MTKKFSKKNKFLNWLKQIKKSRSKRFAWKDDEIEHHEKQQIKESNLNIPKIASDHINQLKEWRKHGESLNDQHVTHLYGYKMGSEINHKIVNKHPLSLRDIDHIKHLDHVTSHKTKFPVTVYRGYDSEHENSKFPVGHEFTNNGYTSTTLKKKIASSFSDGDSLKKPTIFKIKITPGTRAHHVDCHTKQTDKNDSDETHKHNINPHPHEEEVLIGRKQKFKVTGHSEDLKYKYIHVDTI